MNRSTSPMCSVDGCSRPAKKKHHLCSMHAARLTRTGSTGEAAAKYERGRKGGSCSVDGCQRKIRSVGLCAGHYARFNREGAPGNRAVKDKWERNDPLTYSYDVWHLRMRKDWGPASQHACIACGGRAHQWAYQYNGPEDLWDGKVNSPYYPSFACYEPMCCLCHVRFDRGMAAATGRS